MNRIGQKSPMIILLSAFAVLSLILAVIIINDGYLSAPVKTNPVPAAPDEALIAQLDISKKKIEELSEQLKQLSEPPAPTEYANASKTAQELKEALSQYGITLFVSSETGDLTLDKTILFINDRYDLSADARDFLDNVFPVIAAVVTNPDNIGSIKSLNIVGHTNPVGDISNSYNLSHLRSLAVAEYISNADYMALTPEQKTAVFPLLNVSAVSENYPVYDRSGAVDENASRRVEFSITFLNPEMGSTISKILVG